MATKPENPNKEKAEIPNPVASQNVAGYGQYGNKVMLSKIRPSAKENGRAYFKTFDAETPVTNFRNQQKTSLRKTFQEATETYTKIEPTDDNTMQGHKTAFQNLLRSFELQQNTEVDHILDGFQKQLSDLAAEQKANEGIDAETAYNRMQRLRGEQTEKLKGALTESERTTLESIDSPEFTTQLKAINPQITNEQIAKVKNDIKAGLKKHRNDLEKNFNEMYADILLHEQGKLMTEQNANKYAKEFVELYEDLGLTPKTSFRGTVGAVTPTGEPISLPSPLPGNKVPTHIDGTYFQVNNNGSVHLDARFLSREDRLIYIRDSLAYMVAEAQKRGITLSAVEFNSQDPRFIDDVIQVATTMNIQVKNQSARTSIPVDWAEDRREPVAVSLAKQQVAKQELETDLKLQSKNDPSRDTDFKKVSEVIERVDSLALGIKQDLANVESPQDMHDIEKSSRQAGSSTNFTQEEKLNKLTHVENLQKDHLDSVDKMIDKLDQLCDGLQKQANNYEYALSDVNEDALKRKVHEGALYKLQSAFIPIVKGIVSSTILKKIMPNFLSEPKESADPSQPPRPPILGHSKTLADQEAEGMAQNFKDKYGNQESVDLHEFSAEASARVEAVRETKQKDSIEKNVLLFDEAYNAIKNELENQQRSINDIRTKYAAFFTQLAADEARLNTDINRLSNTANPTDAEKKELEDAQTSLDKIKQFKTKFEAREQKVNDLLANNGKLAQTKAKFDNSLVEISNKVEGPSQSFTI